MIPFAKLKPKQVVSCSVCAERIDGDGAMLKAVENPERNALDVFLFCASCRASVEALEVLAK